MTAAVWIPLGTSITWGANLSLTNDWYSHYRARVVYELAHPPPGLPAYTIVSKGRFVDGIGNRHEGIVGRSIPGNPPGTPNPCASLLEDLRGIVLREQPDIVTLEIGANDVRQGADLENLTSQVIAAITLAKSERPSTYFGVIALHPIGTTIIPVPLVDVWNGILRRKAGGLATFIEPAWGPQPILDDDKIHWRPYAHWYATEAITRWLRAVLATP